MTTMIRFTNDGVEMETPNGWVPARIIPSDSIHKVDSKGSTLPFVRVINGQWQEFVESEQAWVDRDPSKWAPPTAWVPVGTVTMSKEAGVAGYGEPSMVGTDGREDEGITVGTARRNILKDELVRPEDIDLVNRKSEIMQVHKLLDNAGVNAGGDLMERVSALIDAAQVIGVEGRNGSTTQHDVPEDIWTREQEIQQRVQEITAWWYDHAANVIDRTAPKAAEYGAADLDLMGKNMEVVFSTQLRGTDRDFAEQFGRYAACAFYLQGKIARIFGALERGELPNPDSEFDIEVYAVMLDRIREFGRWV